MRHRAERLFDAVAAALCLVAWLLAWQSTRGLTWPCESDFYRDMGAAQTVLDGAIGTDPGYAGERWWYSPLIPTLVAAASKVTGQPLPEAYATLGTHLNLLAPVAFYALLAVLFQRGVALAGLVGFLFLGQLDLMSWMHATYSPWLWPCNFAQALFYAALALLITTFKTRSMRFASAAGLGLGLTALAHAAPALLLGAILVVLALTEIVSAKFSAPTAKQTLLLASVVGFVGTLVAAPFFADIAIRYHWAIRNPAPLQWVAGELTVARWPQIWLRLLSLRGLVGVLGLLSLIWVREPEHRLAKRSLLIWGGVAVLGLGYGFAAQLARLPPFLPSWHFYFYLQALESVLFGLGVAALATLASRTPLRRFAPAESVERYALSATVAVLLLVVLVRFDRYQTRPDLVANRRDSLSIAATPDTELYRFILGHTAPTDVILADEATSLLAVLPAGRKSIALPAIFSNPYVDRQPRFNDAAAMLEHLRKARWQDFSRLARSYDVRYVALPTKQRSSVKKLRLQEMKRVYSSKDRARGSDLYEIVAKSD